MEQLIVLGNGSDLHNRLKSSYDNYVTYMDSKWQITILIRTVFKSFNGSDVIISF